MLLVSPPLPMPAMPPDDAACLAQARLHASSAGNTPPKRSLLQRLFARMCGEALHAAARGTCARYSAARTHVPKSIFARDSTHRTSARCLLRRRRHAAAYQHILQAASIYGNVFASALCQACAPPAHFRAMRCRAAIIARTAPSAPLRRLRRERESSKDMPYVAHFITF